jgi:hypothetical protein
MRRGGSLVGILLHGIPTLVDCQPERPERDMRHVVCHAPVSCTGSDYMPDWPTRSKRMSSRSPCTSTRRTLCYRMSELANWGQISRRAMSRHFLGSHSRRFTSCKTCPDNSKFSGERLDQPMENLPSCGQPTSVNQCWPVLICMSARFLTHGAATEQPLDNNVHPENNGENWGQSTLFRAHVMSEEKCTLTPVFG